MDSYKYLFPYEKIEPGARVLIYGAGVMGQDYLRQMLITSYCEVVGMVDKNYRQYVSVRIPVYSPDAIPTLKFDYVVIALQKSDWLNEVLLVLKNAEVPEDKIVYTFLRDTDDIVLLEEDSRDEALKYAFERAPVSVAFSVTGGIGDMVMQKCFITALVSLLGNCSVDIFNVDTQEMLVFLYQNAPFINCILPNLGIRYDSNCKKYSLSIFIEGGAFIRVDHVDQNAFKDDPKTVERIGRIVKYCEHECASMSIPVHTFLTRRMYLKKDCYSWFDCGGALTVNRKVTIPLTDSGMEWYKNTGLHGKKYITMDCGNGKCSDERLVSKSWPLEYFEKLTGMIHSDIPGMIVVQVGALGVKKIEGADQRIIGEKFENLAIVLKNSRLHIDIDGGLVHIASQLGTKCAVMFGPTPMRFYGYENNINISAGKCECCFGLYKNMYECAKGMNKPECMYDIKPEMVMDKIRDVLQQ
jgi:hypothetical protein